MKKEKKKKKEVRPWRKSLDTVNLKLEHTHREREREKGGARREFS